jgi:hypothetical protein
MSNDPEERALGRLHAWRKLQVKLALSFDAQPQPHEKDEIEVDRLRRLNALIAVANYLSARGLPDAYCEPFALLAGALFDLNSGKVPALLKPSNLGRGRRRATTETSLIKARVAAAFAVLVTAGYNKKEASDLISRRYPKLSRLVGGKSTSLSASVRSWSSELERRRISDELAQSIYDLEIAGWRERIASRRAQAERRAEAIRAVGQLLSHVRI